MRYFSITGHNPSRANERTFSMPVRRRGARQAILAAAVALLLGLLGAACGAAEAPTDSEDVDTGIFDPSRAPRTAARIAELQSEIPEREPFLPHAAERTADGERIIRDDHRPALFGFDWLTNFGIRIVRFDEFNPRLLRDEIVPLTNPQYITLAEAQAIYVDGSPMILLEVNADVRAYPLEILLWHEIVNDVVGGVPVLMTYCPLCNTAIAFERQVGERTLLFGGSGILRNSDLVMYDRETESLWQQIGGKALVGDMVGATLTPLSAPIVSFGQLRDAFPNALVLSRDTGTPIAYGWTPYTAYDAVDDRVDYRRLFAGELDPRLQFAERVAGVRIAGQAVAYPLPLLMERRVVADVVGGQPIVVFWTPGTRSALDQRRIDESRDVGAFAVFDPQVDGERLQFSPDPDDPLMFRDRRSGSVWNIFGRALSGPLAGTRLTPIVHGTHLWFAWAAFHPDTAVRE